MCEAFGCRPTEAIRELEEAPNGLIWEILELRGYADAKRAVDRNRADKKVPLEVTAMVRKVWDTEREIARDKEAERRDDTGGVGRDG